jgi:hypothetical protein
MEEEMKMSVKSQIKKPVRYIRKIRREKLAEKRISNEREYEKYLIVKDIPKEFRSPLTEQEKRAFSEIWGGVLDRVCYDELEILKYLNGFDPRYIGHDQYLPRISRRLNCYHYTKFYENKGVISEFSRALKMPETVCKCIEGEYYDKHMHQISKDECERLCIGCDEPMVIKPSRESSGGSGIMRLEAGTNPWKDCIVGRYGKDWIIQKCIKQHHSMELFNKSSVNTFRITTLYLNGVANVCNIFLRFGNEGSFVDNHCSGGNALGVYEDGKVRECAFNSRYEKIHEVSGKKINSINFEFLPEVISKVLQAHVNDFPLCKFVGWDIAIDEDLKPILMEINSSQHDVFLEQAVNGRPAFGDRTGEVIEYIKNKKVTYEV